MNVTRIVGRSSTENVWKDMDKNHRMKRYGRVIEIKRV